MEDRNVNSESLFFTREILVALREQTKQLENQKDLQRSLNTLATNINKVAQRGSDLTKRNLTALETEKEIRIELRKSLEAERSLQVEADTAKTQEVFLDKQIEKDLLEAINAAEKGDLEKSDRLLNQIVLNEKLKKTLSQIGSQLNDLTNDVKSYTEEAQEILDIFNKIESIPSIRLFDGLKEATKNIPILSGFFQETSDKAKELAREVETNRFTLEQYLKTPQLLTEEYLKKIDKQTSIIKKASLRLENGSIAIGEDAQKRIQEAGKQGKLENLFGDPNNFIKSLKEGFKEIGPIVKRGFAPLLVIKEFINILLQTDKELVNIQKSFVLNRDEARSFRTELALAADATGNINITATKLLETVNQLQTQFGFVAKFSNETLVTMTKLTQQVGLASEAAGTLAMEAVLSEKTFDEIYKNTLAASYELQRQKGVQFDLRQILEATAKVTGQVRANLAANPERIAKAVTEAKLLGAELEDIKNTSSLLLDFQSSIEKELEAELLLGRDLNLEMARQAALMGDQEEVARQLNQQIGDFTDFSKLNVIQQDALAASMGLTSDRLADILFQQEIQNKTARELRALGKDELADRLEQQTLQEKFNASVQKLKAVFVDAVVAFTPILDVLGGALELVGDLVKTLGPLAKILGGIGVGALVGGIPGAVVGGLAGLYSASQEMNDGIIPPSDSGETIIKRPEGSIKLNKKDTIIAGTELFSDEITPKSPEPQQVTPRREITQTPEPQQVTPRREITQTPEPQQVTPRREITQTPEPQLIKRELFEERTLSELPDYEQVLNETRLGDVFNNSQVSNLQNQTNLGDSVTQISRDIGDTVTNQQQNRVNQEGSITQITRSIGDSINNQMREGDTIQTREGISETRIEPIQSTLETITQMQAAPIQQTAQAADTLISELIAEQKKTQEAIMAQTKILAKGQDTIAKTKTKLQVGATDFGTELNVNSFRIQ